MNLDKTPVARSSDPITSFMAADRVHEFKTAQHQKIMLALLTLGKAGAEEIADLCGMDAYQARKRLPELQRAGMVQAYAETRRTVSGRFERLWGAV